MLIQLMFKNLLDPFQGCFGTANRHGRDQRTGVVKGFHHPGKAFGDINLGIAEQVAGWHPAIDKADGCGIGGFNPEFMLKSLYGHAGRTFRHHKRLDGRTAEFFIQRGPDHHGIGAFTRGHKDFLAIQDIIIAICDRCGANCR